MQKLRRQLIIILLLLIDNLIIMTRQKFSIRKRILSFKYAFRGIVYLLKTQHNAWIHSLAAIFVIVAGFYFSVSTTEWMILTLTIGTVFMAEAVNTAIALAKEGAKVGLLDADVFGPSVPMIMGIDEYPAAYEQEDGRTIIVPILTHGVKVMSLGFLIQEDQPVIWRGPMVTQLLRQFSYDVEWQPLDYLIIDMPPGTGDVALTISQSLPLSGALIVTTPQMVATADVIKAMQMFRKVNVPLLGIVENMAYFVAPDTGTRYDIFGTGGAERLAHQLDVPLLGQVPIGLSVREGGDTGVPAATNDAPDAYADVFHAVAQQVAARVSVLAHA